MTAVFDHGLTADSCIALDDLELAGKTFELIGDASDELSSALYFLVGEMLERFAPDVARADLARIYNDPREADELLDALAGLRRRQAARLLRDTLGADDA